MASQPQITTTSSQQLEDQNKSQMHTAFKFIYTFTVSLVELHTQTVCVTSFRVLSVNTFDLL